MEESNPMISICSDNEKVIVGAQAIEEQDVFRCNNCMDPPSNAVLTLCGHLFCWSCIDQWLEKKVKPCPVCKFMLLTNLNVEKVLGGAKAMAKQHVFRCNLCMEHPTNPVLTTCGHLFCWSCLYKWLQNKKLCSMCKLVVGSCRIIPIYGCQRGSSSESSDDSTPPCPSPPLTHVVVPPCGGDFESESDVEEIDEREYNRALHERRLFRQMGK